MKKIFFGWLTFLWVLLISFGACELLVRVLFYKAIGLFPRYVTGADYGEFSIRRNIPNARYRHKSYDGKWFYQINSQGFRADKNYSYEKKAGTLRILTLGDSFTMGFEVNKTETYSAVLEKELREKGIEAEVINTGVSGFSTAEELVFLEQEGLKYQPDVVILGFFENDWTDNLRADLYRLEKGELILNKKEYLPAIGIRNFLYPFPPYRWLSEYSYLFNYLNIVVTVYAKKNIEDQNLKQLSTEGNLLIYQSQLTKALLKKIYEVAKRNKSIFILMDIPKLDGNASLPKDASSGVLADIFVEGKEFLEFQKGKSLYRPYGQHHWTETAHEAAGKYLAQLIERQIKSDQS